MSSIKIVYHGLCLLKPSLGHQERHNHHEQGQSLARMRPRRLLVFRYVAVELGNPLRVNLNERGKVEAPVWLAFGQKG